MRASRGIYDKARVQRGRVEALQPRQTQQRNDFRDSGPAARRASISKTDLVFWRISPEHVDRGAQPGFIAPDIRFEVLQTRGNGELLCVGKRKRGTIELPRPDDAIVLYERPETEKTSNDDKARRERFFLWSRRRYMIVNVSEVSSLLAEFVLRKM